MNAKPMGIISLAAMSTWTQLQTINTKPMGTILSARIFQPGTITSLTVIKVEYIVKLYKFYF